MVDPRTLGRDFRLSIDRGDGVFVPVGEPAETPRRGLVIIDDPSLWRGRYVDSPRPGGARGRYWHAGGKLHCRHGVLLSGDSCVTCEAEGDDAVR